MSYDAPPRRSPVIVAVALLLVLALIGGGAAAIFLTRSDDDGPGPSTPSGSTDSTNKVPRPTNPALARFYDQKLKWSKCQGNECAKLKVPLDYGDLDGKTIEIAVLKVPAGGRKIGSLVVNPGGPGGSGVEYAAYGSLAFGRALADRYDIVGFDPRGVGASSPVDCATTAQLDALVAFDPDPDDADERAGMDKLIRGFGEGCLANTPDIARHMSTEEAARDIDVLRAALGEDKLDYLGASYGTFLGATYADLFPTHVGRMVLDGALDPSLSNEQLNLAQAHGFEVALRAYVKDCVDQGGCFLGDTVDEGTKRIRQILDDIEAKPLPTDTDRELTAGTAMLGVWMPLYVESFWPELTKALKEAIDGDGSGLLALSDRYASRGSEEYEDNSFDALYAVNCLDHSDSIPTSQVPSKFAEFEKASPTFGRAFAFGTSTCSVWPVKTGKEPRAAAREGRPADRRTRDHPRPRDTAGVGRGAGEAARLRGAGHARRRRAHRLPAGQQLHRRRRRGLPDQG